MKGNNLTPPSPPDFDKMTWKCPCCSQLRTDKYIKVISHDVSRLHNMETGVMFVNVKYCVDVPMCKEKAFDREWVLHHFFEKQVKHVAATTTEL